jgi:hypothetical protein
VNCLKELSEKVKYTDCAYHPVPGARHNSKLEIAYCPSLILLISIFVLLTRIRKLKYSSRRLRQVVHVYCFLLSAP